MNVNNYEIVFKLSAKRRGLRVWSDQGSERKF